MASLLEMNTPNLHNLLLRNSNIPVIACTSLKCTYWLIFSKQRYPCKKAPRSRDRKAFPAPQKLPSVPSKSFLSWLLHLPAHYPCFLHHRLAASVFILYRNCTVCVLLWLSSFTQYVWFIHIVVGGHSLFSLLYSIPFPATPKE